MSAWPERDQEALQTQRRRPAHLVPDPQAACCSSAPSAEVQAVDEVDLAIEEGKTLALVGESGCGKTTVGSLDSVSRGRAQEGRGVVRGGRSAHGVARGAEALPQPTSRSSSRIPMASLNPRMRVRDIIAEGMRQLRHRRQRVGANRPRRRPPRAGEARSRGRCGATRTSSPAASASASASPGPSQSSPSSSSATVRRRILSCLRWRRWLGFL